MLKHVFATVITSMALLATGAVSTAGTAATTAAPVSQVAPGCAYPDTVSTFTNGRFADRSIRSGTRATLFVRVRASGTARFPIRGVVVVRVAGRTLDKRIFDGRATFRLPRLEGFRNRPRFYSVRIRFIAPRCSIYRNSSTVETLKVLARRR
jgi:hypothetical protein